MNNICNNIPQITDLIEISHFYGNNKEYVIAGGGNTSFKNKENIWVKASGTNLATIAENGFAVLDREKLAQMDNKQYSTNASEREIQVKNDLFAACVGNNNGLRPSVETSLHNVIDFNYVVHTHPTLINALLCSNNAQQQAAELFPENALFIPYTDPGMVLFKLVQGLLLQYHQKHGKHPQILLLQNHGLFVAANSVSEIKDIYNALQTKLSEKISIITKYEQAIDAKINQLLPAIRMIVSDEALQIVSIRNNTIIEKYCASSSNFNNCLLPFTPDQIVYCKARPIFIEQTLYADVCINEFREKYQAYKQQHGYAPKVALFKGLGLVAIDDTYASTQIILDVFEDLLLIAEYSQAFGGPHFMKTSEIEFIENWEVENYRLKVSKGSSSSERAENKVIIITGAAQGFGAGIAELLFNQQANIVIADLNSEKGFELASQLNNLGRKNGVLFVKTDVSDESSLQNLVYETIKTFGGVDVFISNAGILRAGGLDELSLETFELMTKVNYTSYFLCAKYASEVMKLQHSYNNSHFMDIIQINSKSGLKGSNKNFAYAGGKFGGIGLTQSFALELIPFNIKVNSICPGNFFEGPLWSDPEKGLFLQYLNTGKVPGAKTIDDVKKFYEAQVPMKRGCRVEDVVKAIYYVMDQHYETGQAIPVTGGQNMLN